MHQYQKSYRCNNANNLYNIYYKYFGSKIMIIDASKNLLNFILSRLRVVSQVNKPT